MFCCFFPVDLWNSYYIPPFTKIFNSPAVYPQALAILLIILSVILIFSGIRQIKIKTPILEAPKDLSKPLLISATLVGYLILLLTSNFVIATFIFLILVFRFLGGSWKEGVVLSILLTIGEFLVFGSLLKVPLP